MQSLGITEEEIEKANITKNYSSIIRKLQIKFTMDVIQNSSRRVIRMSNEISKALHELRNINSQRIISSTIFREDNEIYPEAIKTLMLRYASIIEENDMLMSLLRNHNLEFTKEILEKYDGTPDEDFVRYATEVSFNELSFIGTIMYDATEKSIEEEQAIARSVVLENKEFSLEKGYENRYARISEYIEYYKQIGLTGNYSEEQIENDIKTELTRQFGDKSKGKSLDRKIAMEIRNKIYFYTK